MGRNEFLKRLEKYLLKVPERDRKDMLYDFEEHFTIGMENGKTEEEVVSELGDPQMIAKDIIADYRISAAETNKSVSNITRAMIATISLSFFNLVFLFGPVIGLIGVYIGLCVTAFVLTITPLLVVFAAIFTGFEQFMLQFFLSLICCALGLLMSMAMINVGKWFYAIILRYIKFNVKVIKGGK
ncbi:DUF1700 domain-containing protein [Heyndrickxia vini]|uniref:DUF1700 domain-containing protein n=1 Tax=Heyndrickxia vini TaxID=1476025 RepID=A0ABX7DZG8_9BACI|nr:DUF1700 domain-containing protein [Heyndrickxia vini]QQZ08866.1 DUF1700 domain-containing protein [Heyndrickxia vini]